MSNNDDTELNDTTKDTETRWKYLASLVTGVYLIGLLCIIALAGAGIITLASITQGWFVLISTLGLMAGTWLWGTDTLKAVRETRE